MALSANTPVLSKGSTGKLISLIVKAATTIYQGGLSMVSSVDGFAVPCAALSTGTFMGIAYEQGAASTKCRHHTDGIFLLVGVGLAQTDVGQKCYASADNAFSSTNAGDEPMIGVLVEYVSETSGWVMIDSGIAGI